MPDTPTLAELIGVGRAVDAHRSSARVVIDPETWQTVVENLAASRFTLSGLWGDTNTVHMALLDESPSRIAILTLPCPHGRFPSVAKWHLPALRLERTIRDLYGLEADNTPDPRPWLNHGRWGVRHPLGPNVLSSDREPYTFLTAEGESLHQIAVGPVHAGVIEPGHFRFNVSGEAIVRLEPRLGYSHKGVESLMQGSDVARAAQLAGRLSGDSTVAYAIAFARAIEAALEADTPTRAHWLRALMAELERLANHFGDIGAICNDASFSLMHAHCAILRERVLRASDICFGHRLMRDCVVPGGVSRNLDAKGTQTLLELLTELNNRFPALIELYDNTASLQDRTVGTGVLRPELAHQFGAGGFVGRASGRGFDARRALAYPPYDQLAFEVPTLQEGDVNARVWLRIHEVKQSIAIINQVLTRIPDGTIRRELSSCAGEGTAIVEGFRGDILAFVRLGSDGRIERCHLRDPSWFQWPLLEAAIEGNIVADFPICNKSFNCSYSGHDL
jgi:Ni,Fe-hydrogenase III large subunit/Ni,Fe-hydrogenase III component G